MARSDIETLTTLANGSAYGDEMRGAMGTILETVDAPAPGPSSGVGGVTLESFSGASDDEKLGNAMSWVAAQTYKPPILLLENREYGSFTTPRDLFSGFKLLGGAAFSNQYRSALSTPQRVNVNTSGAWLRMPTGNVFDVEISRLSFYSQSSTTDFLGGHSSGVLWTSVIRDVGFSLFRHVLGSPTTKLLNTALICDGWWNVNNGRGAAMTVGGSDSTFWPDGILLDSPTTLTAGVVPYHMYFSFQSKSFVGPMYVTAESEPAAVRITGTTGTSVSGAQLIFHGTRMEGRNADAPSYGSVIRMEGGMVTFRDIWASYGFSDPASSGRSSEGGVISVLGGTALFDGCYYSRATGVAEDVPFIYASGQDTKVRVRNTVGVGDWAGLPRVQAANNASVDTDNSVTVV
ncbi:MAG: hypothetical protein ABR616_03645 [Dermatophilaceae bacterium]|nr:hypothetical protein [Intrasporangiaceae bacterium]